MFTCHVPITLPVNFIQGMENFKLRMRPSFPSDLVKVKINSVVVAHGYWCLISLLANVLSDLKILQTLFSYYSPNTVLKKGIQSTVDEKS